MEPLQQEDPQAQLLNKQSLLKVTSCLMIQVRKPRGLSPPRPTSADNRVADNQHLGVTEQLLDYEIAKLDRNWHGTKSVRMQAC